MRHSRPTATVAVLTVLGLTAACGSSVSPTEWASEVCTALAPWRDGIQKLTSEAEEAMSAESSPAQARKDLLRLLDGAAQLSEDAHEAVSEAGIPEVESGESIAKRFTASLTETREAYSRAHDSVAKLEADSKDFSAGVAKVMKQLNEDYEDVPQVAELDSDRLQEAFESTESCH